MSGRKVWVANAEAAKVGVVFADGLESEATVIRLRLVIGSEEAISAPRPLPESDEAPVRPAARP